MPAVRDHDKRQHVTNPGDLRQHIRVRGARQGQLEQPQDLAPLSHRREDHPTGARPVGPGRGRSEHLHGLGAQRLLDRACVGGNSDRLLTAVAPDLTFETAEVRAARSSSDAR